MPKSLIRLNLSSMVHFGAVKRFILNLSTSKNLKYLNMQSNFITYLTSFNANSLVPMEVDFSRNNMISFAGAFDEAIVNNGLVVHGLILSENRLGGELEKYGDRIFTNFHVLAELDLSSNDIKTLPSSVFENLGQLEYLSLSRNALNLIRFKIVHMTRLKRLDISSNLLSQFDVKLQEDVDFLKQNSPNLTINMLDNPFQCSCETRHFLEWMHDRHSMFYRYDEYNCLHDNNPFKFKNITQLLNILHYQCTLNTAITVSASLLAFLIFVIALSVFLYRHKWDVRFFFLKYVTNRKAYQELEDSEEEYEYDAFVSFHSDDQDWVWNELHENLDSLQDNMETDDLPRFRLCIHERDFVPGDLIEENILRSIESSRKTIVVLSRNFLQSVWCEFELQIARKLCVDKGRDLIIAVMLEPLPTNIKIAQSVERLVRKNTYIEWPTDPLARIQFWEKMRSALSK